MREEKILLLILNPEVFALPDVLERATKKPHAGCIIQNIYTITYLGQTRYVNGCILSIYKHEDIYIAIVLHTS